MLNKLNLLISLITGYDLKYINKYVIIINYNFKDLVDEELNNSNYLLFIDNNKKHKYLIINVKRIISKLLFRYYIYTSYLYKYDYNLINMTKDIFNNIASGQDYKNLNIDFYIKYIRPNLGLIKLNTKKFKINKTFIKNNWIEEEFHNIKDYKIINSDDTLTCPNKFYKSNFGKYFYAIVLKSNKFIINNNKIYKVAYLSDIVDEVYYEYVEKYLYVTYKLAHVEYKPEEKKNSAAAIYKINTNILDIQNGKKNLKCYKNYNLIIVTEVNQIFPQFLTRKNR